MIRHREDSTPGSVQSTSLTIEWGNQTCSDPLGFHAVAPYNGSFTDGTSSRWIDDTVVPNYYWRSAHGEIFNNPMASGLTQVTKTPINVVIEHIRWVYLGCPAQTYAYRSSSVKMKGTISPDLLGNWYPATPSLSEEAVKSIAVTAAHANVSGADINAWATAAESGETVHSFLSIGGRLIRSIKALKKGNLASVWKSLTPKQLSERWMEGRYAVRPLIYDIHGTIAALQPLVKVDRQTFRGQASETASAQAEVLAWTNSDPNYAYKCWGLYETSRTITARAGVLTAIEEISNISRWGLDQPVEALWEIVPYSFICDWFFNVGKTIASWTPNIGFKQLASWVTVSNTVSQSRKVARAEFTYPVLSDTVSKYISITGGNCTSITTAKYRLPNPMLSIVPRFTPRLDAAKLLDLVIIGKKLLS